MTQLSSRRSDESGASVESGTRGRLRRLPRPVRGLRLRWPSWPTSVLALIAYVPLLFTARGYVGADTKQYLYLDPSKLLARAPYLWDEHIGAGSVTHQNIGYLFPQGPWYWFFQTIGAPDWLAQRLWTATILFAAGAGVLYLVRTLGWRNLASFVAALAYMLSPYVLEYESRISAILLPWAGLPWMVALVARGLRRQARAAEDGKAAGSRWRYPALFAVVAALVGATNATSLLYAGLAPALWLPFALAHREVTFRQTLAFVGRTLLLTIGVSIWWMAGLASQAGYGLDVLAYSETVKTVASGSQASEVLRGLGNWYFYGRDGVAPWVKPSESYTENVGLIIVSFAVPAIALLCAVCIRWIHRSYFATLVLVGTAVAVGVYPYKHPSPGGSVFKAFAEGSTAGLALRSTPRAVPLVALGLAVLLAGGLDALARRFTGTRAGLLARLPRWTPAVAFGIVIALVVVDMIPLFQGQFVEKNLRRPEKLPNYVSQAANYLNAKGNSTRVLELPGADFSHYRWGATLDPPLPGLMDRPYVSRELIPFGTPGSADLIRAMDRRLQEGVFESQSMANLAQLLSIGDLVLRNDLQYERFRTPRPRQTWLDFFANTPEGLNPPQGFGPPMGETPVIPLTDEVTLGTSHGTSDPPAMAAFGVQNAVPIVHAERADNPLLLAGSGEGMVDAAADGALNGTGVVRYAASLDAAQIQADLNSGADLLLTDSNRLQAERWGTVRENYGFTEDPNSPPLVKDPTDARLPVFPNETTADQTVAQYRGVAAVRASDYGNPVAYAPADRPANALDGDPTSAWRVGAFSDVRGERLRIDLQQPVHTSSINLVQPITGPRNRFITKVQLSFDGGKPVELSLGDASRTQAGQTVSFGDRTFSSVEIKVLDTNVGVLQKWDGQSGVGLAEVRIPGVKLDEVLRLPTDLLSAAGAASLNSRLAIQVSRQRADPMEPFKSDPEVRIARTFSLPTDRTFDVAGTIRVAADASDQLIDRTLGRPTGSNVVRATSSARLPGDMTARASSAADNDPATAWTAPFGSQQGQWVQLTAPQQTTLSSLDLKLVADGRHSVPTRLTLMVDGKPARDLRLPATSDVKQENGTVSARVNFAPVRGTTFRLVVTDARLHTTRDYFGGQQIDEPVAIAEIGARGLTVPAMPAKFDTGCRTDLLTLDGKPVPVRATGSTTDAQRRNGMSVSLCGPAPKLSAGSHDLRSGRGRDIGLDVDRVVLASAAGGAAGSASTPFAGPSRTSGTPDVQVRSQGPVSYKLHVSGATPGKPFWLVLGQSQSAGWKATAAGLGDLGEPQLVDGYANGWFVTPKSGDFDVSLDWTPQKHVWIGLAISVVAMLVVLLLIFLSRRRRGRPEPSLGAADPLPELESPLTREPARPSLLATIGGVLAVGLATAVIVQPVAGLVAAVLTAIALRVSWGRVLLRLGAVACLLISGGYVAEVQFRYHLPENGGWVAAFAKVATLSWFAVVLLMADVVVAWLLVRARRDPTPPTTEPVSAPATG